MKHLYFFVSIFATIVAFGQGVSINEDGSDPHESAILEVKSNNKGLLLPRLSNSERDNITNPAAGLYIFNTSTNKMNYYNGSFWVAVPQSDCPYKILSPLKQLDVNSGTYNFSVDNSADITDFVWSVPQGWTISSGQGTNSIEVNINDLTTTETVSVSMLVDDVEQCFTQYNFVKTVLKGGTKTIFIGNGTNGIIGKTYEMSVFEFSGDNDTLEILSSPSEGQIQAYVWGAGGGFGGTNAGSGGFSTGKLNVSAGQQYVIRTGGGGFRAPSAGAPVPLTNGPYPGGGGTYGTAGTGGGYSGLFDLSLNPLLIAGGGGGVLGARRAGGGADAQRVQRSRRRLLRRTAPRADRVRS